MAFFHAEQQGNIVKSFQSIFLLCCCFTNIVLADEAILSDIVKSSDTKSIEKCVAKINRNPDELLDVGKRLYLTSICYFCAGCNLEEDNGHVFGSEY